MRGDGWGERILEAFGKEWHVGKVREVIIMAPGLREATPLWPCLLEGGDRAEASTGGWESVISVASCVKLG